MALFFVFHGVVIWWAKEGEQVWIALLSPVAKCGQGCTSVPGRAAKGIEIPTSKQPLGR